MSQAQAKFFLLLVYNILYPPYSIEFNKQCIL